MVFQPWESQIILSKRKQGKFLHSIIFEHFPQRETFFTVEATVLSYHVVTKHGLPAKKSCWCSTILTVFICLSCQFDLLLQSFIGRITAEPEHTVMKSAEVHKFILFSKFFSHISHTNWLCVSSLSKCYLCLCGLWIYVCTWIFLSTLHSGCKVLPLISWKCSYSWCIISWVYRSMCIHVYKSCVDFLFNLYCMEYCKPSCTCATLCCSRMKKLSWTPHCRMLSFLIYLLIAFNFKKTFYHSVQ